MPGRESTARRGRWTSLTLAPLSVVVAAGIAPDVISQGGIGTAPPPASPPPAGSVAPAPPAPATGVISGVVVDGATGAPIGGALVYLGRSGREAPARQSRQVTDERGRFAITALPPSETYSLSATAPGYFDGGYSSDESTGSLNRLVSLAADEWIGNARITMWKPAAISGRVVDEAGEPVVGVYVRALAEIRVAGRSHLAAAPVTTTDDRGEYRLSGLPPGRYVVSVPSPQNSVLPTTVARFGTGRGGTPGAPPFLSLDRTLELDSGSQLIVDLYPIPPPSAEGQRQAYPTTFHGGSTLIDAVRIAVDFGEERAGMDVQLTPVAAAPIAGRVEGADEGMANMLLRLLAPGFEESGLGSEAATTRVAPDGTFVFPSVPIGTYTLDASGRVGEYGLNVSLGSGGQLPRPPTESSSSSSASVPAGPPGTTNLNVTYGGSLNTWARTAVTVGPAGLSNVVLSLRPLGRIAGHIVLERASAGMAEPAFVSVRAETADGSAGGGQLNRSAPPNDPGRRFTIEGLLPRRYLLRGIVSTGWMVKSIVYDGHDHLTTPFDAAARREFDDVVVTMTSAVSLVSGTVRDAQGAASARSAVIVFPVETDQWTDYGMNPVRIRSVLTSNTGQFRLDRLPAGAYHVIALPERDATAWQQPDFFQTMAPRAEQIRIGWGEQRSLDLREVTR
jgi:protocatechuate 3,4-dioxygenase beta subunit